MIQFTYESIEAWAKAHALTLNEALEVGVSQDEEGIVHVPDEVWAWAKRQYNGKGEV